MNICKIQTKELFILSSTTNNKRATQKSSPVNENAIFPDEKHKT